MTIPANLTSTLFIQMCLVTAIDILQGHDMKDERIKSLVYLPLCVMTGKHKLQHICFDVLMKKIRRLSPSLARILPVILFQLSVLNM
ncbi:hypothetical protein FPQ14_08595 [Gilliamella apicola]|uniref:Uncharacterized protein n=1 Tax=Gilliamella apicola TaxID=1196095 RepID=A0A556RKV1_9GAMM|nr:hypothetical protein [Gilliamella apicola]TSJ89539.1 hypothetical protein FPQ14_08595 [Gilliamella apicola]